LPAPGTNGDGHGARFTETGERLRKTNLTPADLEEFRQLLSAKRSELIGDMNHLRNEALGHGSSGEGGGNSTMPIHMADLGSDTWEQELTLGLIEKERGLLREIEEALDRIEDRTYGICLATNKPISKARLRAKPWAKHCIEYARKRELGLG
jgi:DnaK suppressor protein